MSAYHIKHGTFYAYNDLKCRCIDCRDFMRDYRAKLYGGTGNGGVTLSLHGPSVRALMAERGITTDDLAAMVGVHPASIYQFIRRERVGLYTLDRIAVALGTHYMLLTPDDCVSKEA